MGKIHQKVNEGVHSIQVIVPAAVSAAIGQSSNPPLD
jgi:hypothetical protein